MSDATDDLMERVTVEYEVTTLERLRRPGRVVAIACVVLTVSGVETLVQGVTVKRMPDGRLTVSPPVWKHPATGALHPAVKLPPEVSEAIATELFTMMAPPLEAGRA